MERIVFNKILTDLLKGCSSKVTFFGEAATYSAVGSVIPCNFLRLMAIATRPSTTSAAMKAQTTTTDKEMPVICAVVSPAVTQTYYSLMLQYTKAHTHFLSHQPSPIWCITNVMLLY